MSEMVKHLAVDGSCSCGAEIKGAWSGADVDEWFERHECYPTSSGVCVCTMDEYLDGHRCRCEQHLPCGECENDD